MGHRGVVVFALFIAFNFVSTMIETALGLRLDHLHRLVTFRSLSAMGLFCLFATQLRGKILAAKGTNNYRCNSVISWVSNFVTPTTLHLQTPSPVTARLYSTSLNN